MPITNEAALALLAAKRASVNAAINGIVEYQTNKDEWKAAVVTAKMSGVRTQAGAVDVDLADWDGSAEPVVAE
jgi:hypothetical protein|tara:strand:+ start:8617 stop:8835 length:219 start_codon:yes stop_codon:yes gene_type:complete